MEKVLRCSIHSLIWLLLDRCVPVSDLNMNLINRKRCEQYQSIDVDLGGRMKLEVDLESIQK